MNINATYEQARKGDKASEKRLFADLSVRLRLIAYQRIWNESDSEDVAQEALMIIAREFKTIDITTSFSAWACKVLDNRVLTYIRTKRTRQERIDNHPGSIDGAGVSHPDPDLKLRLLDCIKKVGLSNQRYARVLNLHYQGYSVDEVCSKLEITANHAYVTLSRARSLLKHCLEKGDLD